MIKMTIINKNNGSHGNRKEGNEMKKYFTEVEALQDIKELLEEGFTLGYSDLHNYVFNESYYIIGTHEAKQALNQFDTFKAIEKVFAYEVNNFGEIITPIDPERIATMLYYIIGEEVMTQEPLSSKLEELYNTEGNDDDNAELIKIINSMIE